MVINRENVIEIIEKSGLKPDKDYGQNYLLDSNACFNIVELLGLCENDTILEVGPGLGSLTHFICEKKYQKFDLVDIDFRMIDFLKIIYSNEHNNFIVSDIRKHDVSQYTKIIGNLPYNITTETVLYLVENGLHAQRMVLMCQAEAFARFSDKSGKEYGPLSILITLLGTVKRRMTIKPGAFYPAPKCSSIVFTIDFDGSFDRELAIETYKFAKTLFLNRRKTIYNNLSSLLNNKELALNVLNNAGILPNKRPEEVLPNQYVSLFKQAEPYL